MTEIRAKPAMVDVDVPKLSGQQPRQRCEHGTVSLVRPRPGDPPTQHRDLMPEDQDLRILGGVAAHQQHQPGEYSDHSK